MQTPGLAGYLKRLVTFMQGAIQMARWELDHGSNSQLCNLSQSIIASQTAEIAQMQSYLPQLPSCALSPAPAPSNAVQFPFADVECFSSRPSEKRLEISQ